MSKYNNGMKRSIQMCLNSNMQMSTTLQRNKNDSLSISNKGTAGWSCCRDSSRCCWKLFRPCGLDGTKFELKF